MLGVEEFSSFHRTVAQQAGFNEVTGPLHQDTRQYLTSLSSAVDSVCLARNVSSEHQAAQTGNLHRPGLQPSTAEIVAFQNQFLCPAKQVFEKSHSSAENLSLFHLHLLHLTYI